MKTKKIILQKNMKKASCFFLSSFMALELLSVPAKAETIVPTETITVETAILPETEFIAPLPQNGELQIKTAEASTQTEEKLLEVKANNAKEIDNLIRGLNYDKYEILSKQGDKIENFVPKEGKKIGDKYIVIERKKHTLATNPVDISVVQSIIDSAYPGSLQLANNGLAENRPDSLVLPRKPLNITIDLPGLEKRNTIKVENPTYANVTAAIDELINEWAKNHSGTHTIPAKIQYNESMVYSKSQIAAALNVNADLLEKSLGIDFTAVANGEKNVMIAAYKQIFYTVSAETPSKPSDLFTDDVTAEDLTSLGVNSKNPPVMVKNVSYGRTIYVKLETSYNSKEVEAAFKALINKVNISGNTKYEDILKNSSFTAVVLGGDSQIHNQVLTKNFDDIRNIIKDNATFSLKNPAYPISYTASFLKDNGIAAVNNLTEYIETTSTEYSKGKINLKHTGGYVAQFVVEWDELTYDNEGKEVLTHKAWNNNWNSTTAGFNTVIPLPANAKNIHIYARECAGLFWEWWRVILDEHNVALSPEINVSVWGTTLYPGAAINH